LKENLVKNSIIIALAVAVAAGVSQQAEACNPMLGKNFGKHVAPSIVPAGMLARNKQGAAGKGSVVGLWHDVRTASDGTLFMEGFDTWASDGTEYEIANLPPATGPICVGIYKTHGRQVDLITHVTWLYDLNNDFVGTLNLTQTAKVSADGNSYTGPFDAKFYDPNGNLFQEIVGTAVADRMQ
jgi:hypothetical protein